MTFYTKTQLRPLINENLKMDTLTRWIKRIELYTLYYFNIAVPTENNSYRLGKPVKRKVYDEKDLKLFQKLYELRIIQGQPLEYSICKSFMSDEDFNKWKIGEWDRSLELQKMLQEKKKD